MALDGSADDERASDGATAGRPCALQRDDDVLEHARARGRLVGRAAHAPWPAFVMETAAARPGRRGRLDRWPTVPSLSTAEQQQQQQQQQTSPP